MLRFYPLVIILQVFCLYHAYTNKTEQKWFWIIIILPFFGSLFYLYHHFYSRKNVNLVKEEVKGALDKNYTLSKLERNVKLSDSFTNKMELANEYGKRGEYNQALELYQSCREGIYETDPPLLKKLILTNYMINDYQEAIKYGDLLNGDKDFKTSKEKSMYAWSYYRLGKESEANSIFKELDVAFSNYENRIEYVKFLRETEQFDIAQDKVETMIDEIESMDSYERKLHRSVIREIRQLQKVV